MIEKNTLINLSLGGIILVLNAIPFFTKKKYYGITLPISILLATIRILFIT